MDSSNRRARKAWRIIAALGCIMGASGILAAAILSRNVQHNTDQVDRSAQRGQQAICAIINYGEDTLAGIRENPRPQTTQQRDAVARFRRLVKNMRATGIDCPPPPIEKP
jgi:hypothetical protein